ncbi:MAG: phosphate transport system regulatory protein PhoU [Planctomycetes bacterium RBG_16_64_10]|nr:MAG: phosphate transport system regulatory protein PhoU [Planctomycetes bacterium RBG_16_64_10]
MKKFEQELVGLRRRVAEMGSLSETMVVGATNVIFDPHNQALFEKLSQDESRLDLMQLEIDRDATRMMTIYSPVASDLRFLLAVTRIDTELERIGDHVIDVCEAVQLMASKTETVPLPELRKMANLVKGMVSDSVSAFVQGDIRKAQATIAYDDMVDVVNDQILGELLDDHVVREVLVSDRNIAGALAQLLIARSLERIGDQAVNIGEEVVYMVKGLDIRHRELPGQAGQSLGDLDQTD